MPGLPLLGGVLVSSPTDVPFALASDGKVYVNVTRWEGVVDPELLLCRALMEPGSMFIGVALEPGELKGLLDAVANAASEASAHICGARMWSRRR